VAIAYRVDMADPFGTPLCTDCTDDVADSALFRVEYTGHVTAWWSDATPEDS